MSDKLNAERLRPVLCTAMRFLDYAAGEGIVLNTGGEELDAGDIMSELADACDVADHDADIVEPICAAILAMAEERDRMREALREAEVWLTSALECERWVWDIEQYEAATEARDNAKALSTLALGKDQA